MNGTGVRISRVPPGETLGGAFPSTHLGGEIRYFPDGSTQALIQHDHGGWSVYTPTDEGLYTRNLQPDEIKDGAEPVRLPAAEPTPPPPEPPNYNTIGRVVGETASAQVPAEDANPEVEAETGDERGWMQRVKDGLDQRIDDAVEASGYSTGAMVLGALGKAVNEVFMPTAVWEVVPVGKAAKLLGKLGDILGIRRRASPPTTSPPTTSSSPPPRPQEPSPGGNRPPDNGPGGRVRARQPLECGQRGTYGQLNEFDAASVGMERDHIPPQAALLARARQLAREQGLNIDETPGLLDALKGKIERHGQTVSIPHEVHRQGETNSNPNNRDGARDLQGTARNESRNHRNNMRSSDRHRRCLGAMQRATGEIGRITNQQYDDFLGRLVQDAAQGKRTVNPWRGIIN